MPRPRSLRTAPATADGEEFSNAPVPTLTDEQIEARRARDPAQEQIFRGLPNSLSREMKLAALNWRGGCFCCPADISFAQCMSGLWHAARKPAESADALVHWGLNASKFLFEAGPNASFGRNLLLKAGFSAMVPQLLTLSDEVPQSIALTPQVSFVQVFAVGGRQLPLSTTPQLVILGLLALSTLSPANLREALLSAGGGGGGGGAAAGSLLVPAVVRALASTSDDRLRSLCFQTMTEWVNICQGDPLVTDEEEEEGEEEQGETVDRADGGGSAGGGRSGGGGDGGELNVLIDALLDAGLAGAVVHVMESSSNAAVLRDACAFLLALLGGGLGGGGSGAAAAAARQGEGHQQQRNHGGAGVMRVAGLAAMELPPGTRLEGRVRCRARNELLQAGLISPLLSALSRRPSELRYWVAINLGVSGARLLEVQWLVLLIARICILPPSPSGEAAENGAEPSSSSETGLGGGARTASDGGKGGAPGAPGGKRHGQAARKGRRRTEDAAAAEWVRLSVADSLLHSPMFSPWLKETAKPQEALPVEAAAETDALVEAAAAGSAEQAAAEAAPPAELPADARAVKLLSRVIAASTLRSCVLPEGTPLEALPPRERNVTPDYRALQRDRIRRAAEEARAVQALASANSAVDLLSRAVAAL